MLNFKNRINEKIEFENIYKMFLYRGFDFDNKSDEMITNIDEDFKDIFYIFVSNYTNDRIILCNYSDIKYEDIINKGIFDIFDKYKINHAILNLYNMKKNSKRINNVAEITTEIYIEVFFINEMIVNPIENIKSPINIEVYPKYSKMNKILKESINIFVDLGIIQKVKLTSKYVRYLNLQDSDIIKIKHFADINSRTLEDINKLLIVDEGKHKRKIQYICDCTRFSYIFKI
uniref:Putative DNA-directed RNA polymerase subunit 5 n=1 Tax=Pithovirus LCDPAC02 TaxID=2506601 RepID=A0A481YNU6_9VIRU|nr:MAG: putative DNA-directed RNA polymerase subunit 5 [Pithovirus LCDPAC02]